MVRNSLVVLEVVGSQQCEEVIEDATQGVVVFQRELLQHSPEDEEDSLAEVLPPDVDPLDQNVDELQGVLPKVERDREVRKKVAAMQKRDLRRHELPASPQEIVAKELDRQLRQPFVEPLEVSGDRLDRAVQVV